MSKISIIIPVYNVEPYLVKCLDSVISQTYEDIEILCINDGSTDKSGIICDEYASQDHRIRVFHKKNGGLSTALNIGLKEAKGDYIGFVDSDDWVENDMFETLYNAIIKENTLLSIANYYIDSDTESVPMKNKGVIPNSIITTRNMLLYPLMRDSYMGFGGYVWNKLYNAKKIIKNHLFFDEEIMYGMDIIFYYNFVLLNKCSGLYAEKPVYHYYQRKGAISKSKSLCVKQDILKVYKRVEALLELNGNSDISYWARGFYCYHASVIAEIALENNNWEEFLVMKNEIKDHINDYIKTNEEYPDKQDRMYQLLNRDI